MVKTSSSLSRKLLNETLSETSNFQEDSVTRRLCQLHPGGEDESSKYFGNIFMPRTSSVQARTMNINPNEYQVL